MHKILQLLTLMLCVSSQSSHGMSKNQTELFQAIEKGRTATIKTLIASGVILINEDIKLAMNSHRDIKFGIWKPHIDNALGDSLEVTIKQYASKDCANSCEKIWQTINDSLKQRAKTIVKNNVSKSIVIQSTKLPTAVVQLILGYGI